MLGGASGGSALIPVLGGTGNLQLAVGFATTIGLSARRLTQGRSATQSSNDLNGGSRLLKVSAVAGAVNHRNRGVGEQLRHAVCNGSKFAVCGADDQQDRARNVSKPTPQWLLGAGASEPKTR